MFKDTPEGTTHSYNDGCGIKEHNMTLIEKWQKEKGPMFVYTETEISDWFLSQFDSMLADDIEKMDNKIDESSIEYNAGLLAAIDILEARRLSLKK